MNPQILTTLASATTWALVVTSYLSPVGAQSARPKTSSSGQVSLSSLLNQNPDFSGDGRPGRRAGGGSRSPCPLIDPPLTALVPASNWGKTVAKRPTFWFYVPYSPQEAPTGEFVLQEEKGNDLYRTSFTLPKTPGFVSFSTPPTVVPLEIDKSYRWYLKLYCQRQKSSAPVFVEGWVQRVESPDLESQLQAAKPREYVVYISNGLWYDALARLAELRLANPSNSRFDDDWAKLLGARGVGLEQLSRAPIVGRAILLPLVRSSKPIAY